MTDQDDLRVLLYYLPDSSGECFSQRASSGQSEKEIDAYVAHLEANIPGLKVEPIVVPQEIEFDRDRAAMRLVNRSGGSVCPIFAMRGQVVSAGSVSASVLIARVKALLSDADGTDRERNR